MVELGNQLKPYIYAAPLTTTALWQDRILKTWKNLHKDKYEENLHEYHPHIIIHFKKKVNMKKGNKWYVLKIGIKSFLYIFTDFSPMSKYMLFLTLFPAPTCVSWVTFFIITNNWKWRILKSITWILTIFLRFGVHGDRNHIWAVFQPADQRTPLKGDKRCNFQKAERKWYKVENKKKERKQMVDTFLLKTFSNLLPDHIQWMILIVPHHLKHFTNKLS